MGLTEDITELAPRSVVSDRLLAEIAFEEGGDVRKAATPTRPRCFRRPGGPDSARPSAEEEPQEEQIWHSNKPLS